MVEKVIKYDGSEEPFDAKKMTALGRWMSKGFQSDWIEIVTATAAKLPQVVSTCEIKRYLINECINTNTSSGQKMAGKLYATAIYKEIYKSKKVPPLIEIHRKLQSLGYMAKLDYSETDYNLINNMLDHTRDFDCTYCQLKSGHEKYSLRDKRTGQVFESRQVALMRVAMAIYEHVEDKVRRLSDVLAMYEDLSNVKLSAPTPNHNNFGTGYNGYFSCCKYDVADTKESIAVGTHISEVMTYMSAGLGETFHVRSDGDPIRNGSLLHQGKLPYYTGRGGVVKQTKKGSRAGSLNESFSGYDPDAPDIMVLRNALTPVNLRNRSIDFTEMLNRSMLEKSNNNEDIFLFNVFTAPDLYKALFSKDQDEFKRLYEKYEKDESFKKIWVSAREHRILAESQIYETGRYFTLNIDWVNKHTPFREAILGSNLCVEITQVTHPYAHIVQLYSDKLLAKVKYLDPCGDEVVLDANIPVRIERLGSISVAANELVDGDIYTVGNNSTKHEVESVTLKEQESEITLCALAAIVVSAFPFTPEGDAAYYKTAYRALEMIDYAIDHNAYEFPHLKLTAQARRNAGVGMMDVAYHMAKLGIKMDTDEGFKELHRLAERHAYMLIKASIARGREYGNAEWIHKTDWPRGWTPLKTYARTVDTIADFEYRYDWQALSDELIENGGCRNSSLFPQMPGETSSKYANTTNSIQALKDAYLDKKDGQSSIPWVAPDLDTLKDKYTYGFEMSMESQIKMWAIAQKFGDQSQSAEFYVDLTAGGKIDSATALEYTNMMHYYGHKGRYYYHFLTANQEAIDEVTTKQAYHHTEDLIEADGPVCTSGGCEI